MTSSSATSAARNRGPPRGADAFERADLFHEKATHVATDEVVLAASDTPLFPQAFGEAGVFLIPVGFDDGTADERLLEILEGANGGREIVSRHFPDLSHVGTDARGEQEEREKRREAHGERVARSPRI